MERSFFSVDLLQILEKPWSWRIVCAGLSPEVLPVARLRDDRRHTHAHLFREILIPLRGHCAYGCRGRLYPCEPGMAFLFDIQEPHDDGYLHGADMMDHLWMSVLNGHVLVRLLQIRDGRYIISDRLRYTLDDRQAGVSLYQNWEAISTRRDLPESIKRMRLTASLGVFLARLVELEQEKSMLNISVQEAAVEAIRTHLDETAGRDATLESLARMAGYSKFHLLRIFKRHTGLSVHQYIDRCREQRVRELIELNVPHTRIAAELGFSCPSAFSRWLGSHKGLLHSPG